MSGAVFWMAVLGPEESAYDNGKMDAFPHFVGNGGTAGSLVMGYFDGNTVTAIWNYAQHFALNDNSYATQFGPSTPGRDHLISGKTTASTTSRTSTSRTA